MGVDFIPSKSFPVDKKLFHLLHPFIHVQTFVKIRIFGVNKL